MRTRTRLIVAILLFALLSAGLDPATTLRAVQAISPPPSLEAVAHPPLTLPPPLRPSIIAAPTPVAVGTGVAIYYSYSYGVIGPGAGDLASIEVAIFGWAVDSAFATNSDAVDVFGTVRDVQGVPLGRGRAAACTDAQ